jgi:type I restriction enzyme R subunit
VETSADEIGQTEEKNLAVETLHRLLAGEIKARERTNIVLARKLSERLDDTPLPQSRG